MIFFLLRENCQLNFLDIDIYVPCRKYELEPVAPDKQKAKIYYMYVRNKETWP